MSKTSHVTREASTGRTPLSFTWGSRFNIPQEIQDADPDYQYGFVPDKSDDDIDLLERAAAMGWKEVKADENPELAKKYFNSSYRRKNDGILRKGGQVLMKITKEQYKAMQDHFKQQATLQQNEVKNAAGYQDVMSNNPMLGMQGINFTN